MTYIFLSYAKAEHDIALSLQTMLENVGFRVWMDMNTLELGEEHWPLLEANIQGAAALVLVVSDAARQSKRVRHELNFAESIQKPVFPILVQGDGWEGLQREPLTLDFGLNLDFPETYLAELLALPTSNRPLPAPISIKLLKPADKKKHFQRRWIAGLALVIMVCIVWLSAFSKDENAERERALDFARTSEAQRYLTITALAIGREETRAYLQANATARSQLTETTEAANTMATETYAYQIGQTATVYNQQLPCNATVFGTAFDAEARLIFRLQPSFAATRTGRGYSGQRLEIVEVVVNEDRLWYRVSVENRRLGYALGEELILDETCPR